MRMSRPNCGGNWRRWELSKSRRMDEVHEVVIARDYPFGTALRMGPGYFPSVLGGVLVLAATPFQMGLLLASSALPVVLVGLMAGV